MLIDMIGLAFLARRYTYVEVDQDEEKEDTTENHGAVGNVQEESKLTDL